MNKLDDLRQYISSFIDGPNFQAVMQSIADQLQKAEDLSIAVTNQLSISTSSGVYLDKQLAQKLIVRPADLGMQDLAFAQLGIQVNQAKQITEIVHTVLGTFYGDDVVRGSTVSGIAGPYSFKDGDDLIFTLESAAPITLTLLASSFNNAQSVTTEELCGVITRFIRGIGSQGYAQPFIDADTALSYVQIFGGAKGPFSMIQILGGRIQNQLEFPQLRNTLLPLNTTVWEITRNIGNTHRFRWISGPQPLLDQVLPNDKLLLYGAQFESSGFVGTFDVTQARPGVTGTSADSGFFEIQIDGSSPLASSAPNVTPPPNTITTTYSITLTQSSYDDLKFFLAKKSTPYSKPRYALAWEPTASLLKVYMPATTKIVKRDLIGAAHIHQPYTASEFTGSWGNVADITKQITVLSPYSFKYPQLGSDVLGNGGTVTYGINTIDISYIQREQGYTTVVTNVLHGIPGSPDIFGNVISSAVIGISGVLVLSDSTKASFLGPYSVDTSANYTLTSYNVKLREAIVGGQNKSTLLVQGFLPNQPGVLLFGLNLDTQESPVKYLAAQTANSITPVGIGTISQVATTVTVVTLQPHGAVVGQNVLVSGTVNFNGLWQVVSVPSTQVYTFTKTPSASLFETVGNSVPAVLGAITTLIMDSSYSFKSSHKVGEDVNLLSDTKAYTPAPDGSDYSFYVTGTANGRIFAEQLMRDITAGGINLEIIIVYPNDEFFGNYGDSTDVNSPPISDIIYIYGGDFV